MDSWLDIKREICSDAGIGLGQPVNTYHLMPDAVER
jgi:hypothetical protein